MLVTAIDSIQAFADFLALEIDRYPSVVIYRHENPDGDALGSTHGLAAWLRERYPEKAIYVNGRDQGNYPDFFPESVVVADAVVQDSLVIVCDCANVARIDGQNYALGKRIVKVDHHPGDENYGDLNFVDVQLTSACELVSRALQRLNHGPLSALAASYLYLGLLTDTLRFSIRATTAETLHAAAYLATSAINIAAINETIMVVSEAQYRLSTQIREQFQKTEHGVAYVIVDQKLAAQWGFPVNLIKGRVNDLGSIRECPIWCIFVEDADGYATSMRSRDKTINDIAFAYGGGGHLLACAARALSLAQVHEILIQLDQKLS